MLYVDYSGGALDGSNYIQTTDAVTGTVTSLDTPSSTADHVLITAFDSSV